MQTAIPCLLMRGGTSKGPFFQLADLPADVAARGKLPLAAMGSPDKRQIDGAGGASRRPGVDLEFLFTQLQPDSDPVDITPNCGNMAASVVPFALETGLVKAQGDASTFRVLTQNTDMACDITVQTSGGMITHERTTRIEEVPGTSAPISINVLDAAGSACSSLLPTDNMKDRITDSAASVCEIPASAAKRLSIEHPAGEFSVELAIDPDDSQRVIRAALLRTACLLMRGDVRVPATPPSAHKAINPVQKATR